MIKQSVRTWWPLVAVAGLLVAVGGAAAVATPQLTSIPVPALTDSPRPRSPGEVQQSVQPSIGPAHSDGAARTAVPDWAVMALLVLFAVIVVGGLLGMLWFLSRGRVRWRRGRLPQDAPLPAQAPPQTADVVAAVEAGLSDLSDADLDPRRAVIACWVRLEQVAAAAGTPRHVSDTPTDLVTRLLAAHRVEPEVLAALADIYRIARYTTHTVDEQMRVQARTALQRVRAELTTGEVLV